MLKNIVLLVFLNLILLVNCVVYIDFTPHPKCDTDNQESGIGYSWQVETCISLNDGSYYVQIDPNDKNSINMLFFDNPNSNCGQGETNISRSYSSGNCYQAAWYYDPAFYNVVNYVVMSIVVDPGYVNPEGYRNTLFQKDDTNCQGNPLFSYYYTNGITFKNTMQTFTYDCEQGIPYENLCTEYLSCINTTTNFECQWTDNRKYLYSSSFNVVNCATYINFTPHPKCETNHQESGIGYSWETNTCINLYDGSYYVSIDPNDKNTVNFLFFNNPNSNCGHGETNVSRSYEVGNCYQVAWYYDPAFYNVVNYAVMSIVVDPGYVNPEGYRYTLYQGDDTDCQGNPLFSYYYTNGITFKNTLQTFTYDCEQGIPYEYVCTENVSCINTTTEFQCQKSNDGKHLYSTTC